jgi:hypothetical protein
MFKIQRLTRHLILMVTLPLVMVAGLGLHTGYAHYSALSQNDRNAAERAQSIQLLNIISRHIEQDSYLIRLASSTEKSQTEPDQQSENRTSYAAGDSIAKQLENNLEDTGTLWERFVSSAKTAEESTLKEKFNQQYHQLITYSVRPMIDAVRSRQIANLKPIQDQSTEHFKAALTTIEALVDLNANRATYLQQDNANSSAQFMPLIVGIAGIFLLLWLILGLLAISIYKYVSRHADNIAHEFNIALRKMARGETQQVFKSPSQDCQNNFGLLNIIRNNIEKLANDINEIRLAIKHGNAYSRMAPIGYDGQFRTIIEEINATLDATIDRNIQASADAQSRLNKTQMDTIDEIHQVIVTALAKDINQRVSLEGKTGEMRELCGAVNLLLDDMSRLLETTQAADATMRHAACTLSDAGSQYNVELAKLTALSVASVTAQVKILVDSVEWFRLELDDIQKERVSHLAEQINQAETILKEEITNNETDSEWRLF